MNKLNTKRSLVVIALFASVAACSSNKKTAAKTTPTAAAPAPGAASTTKSGDSSTSSTDSAIGDTTAPASLGTVIYFEFDQAGLGDEARATLGNNATWLKEDASRTLTIEGHTDEVGTPEYNLALGQRRAQTTRDYLVRLGVDKSRVKIITYGEEKPASAEASENRRSVFVATRKKK